MSAPSGDIGAFSSIQFPINANPEYAFASNPAFDRQYTYEWIFILGIISSFITAYGIGANDVANAFATSVGAKSLTVLQAVIIAAIFEFFGAYLLGSRVTDTVRKKIVDGGAYENNDDLLMFGMLCAEISVGFWLFLATSLELPVSTTHSMIGAIIGYSLCSPAGVGSVNWTQVGLIVLSWFASPALSGIFSAIIYGGVRASVLRHDNSFDRAFRFYPILVGFTVALNVFFILFKGGVSKGKGIFEGVSLDIGTGLGISIGVGAGVGILFGVIAVPILKKRLVDLPDEDPEDVARAARINKIDDDALAIEAGEQKSVEPTAGVGKTESRMDKMLSQTKVHESIDTDSKVSSIHENAEKFPYRTERAFAYLQVFTAIFDSFSHGANDVANSIGPLAAIVAIYETGSAAGGSKVPVPEWVLILGGAGIVVGLATYGYKIMAAIGVKLVKVTPSRGFAIELGAAFVIVTGSFLGIPLSTTHCQVGATVGVGLLEGNRTGVNWALMGKVFAGWVMTLLIAGAGSALLFSFATFAPAQYYPMNENNCLWFYGNAINTTGTGPTSITIPLEDNTVGVFLFGQPNSGNIENVAGFL